MNYFIDERLTSLCQGATVNRASKFTRRIDSFYDIFREPSPQIKEKRTYTQIGPSGCPGYFRNFPEPP